MTRVIGIDPGDKRIGIAVSDETGTIANPFKVIVHVKREIDAALISSIADELGAQKIIIGQAINDDGLPSPQGRKAARLAEAITSQTAHSVILWDESGSTQTARSARVALNTRRNRRQGHLDDLAATVMLQSFLDQENAGK